MSGDIQARKRKEKKRKKDEEDNVTPSPVVGNVSENLTDNVTIHIYKESTTGGHWCARIIFFAVLTMLVGLIGVVIIEHRGTTDISTPLESSRWAFIFDGWVEDSLSLSNEDSHDNENENIEQAEDEKNYDEDNEKMETTENEASNEEEIQEDETLNEYAEEDKETIKNESNEEQSDILEDEEELSNENEYESRKQQQIMLEDDDSTFDETNVLEEIYGISTEKDSDEKSVLNEVDNQFDRILEMPRNEDIFEEYLDISGVTEINDDNIEPLEEVESTEPEEYVNDVDVKPEIEEIEEESAGVAMKFGVGLALIVTAHFVLVKRWNNGKYEKEVQDTIGNKIETKKYKKEEEDMEIEEQVDVQKNDEIEEEEKRQEEEEDEEVEEEEEEEQENGVEEEERWEEEEKEEEEEEEEEEEDEEEEEEEEGGEEEEEEIEEDEEEEEEQKMEEKVKNRQKQDDKEKKKTEILGLKINNKNRNNSNKMKQKNEMEIVQKMLKEGEQTDEEIENFDDSELIAKLETKYGKLKTL